MSTIVSITTAIKPTACLGSALGAILLTLGLWVTY